MEQNKTGIYFKYAIGEIVLVVIGILIALQINAWNQQRINKQNEKIALANLKDDVNRQLEEFDATISSEESNSTALLKIGELISKGINSDNLANLNKQLTNIMTFRSVNVFDPTFDELKSTGSLNLISNNDLKRIVVKFYQELGRLDRVLNKNEQTKLHIRDKLVDYSFVSIDINSNEGLQKLLLRSGLSVQNPVTDLTRRLEFDLAALNNLSTTQDILKLNNMITTRYLSTLVSSAVLKTGKESAEKLLKELNNEIGEIK